MSRARHKMDSKPKAYNAKGSDVEKEAFAKNRGGKVVEKPEGGKPKHRMDKRPRRASGGRVGCDRSPFSSAASPKQNTEA